ncbi:MAG: hypothetical protein JRJ39_01990 [Deltaproteobacteria bacterium]|nr:hypothetical protein [Deltaproteobacteria bacterium]MBW1847393.1 hypothetical protein [Deltaproteobacteria bacterium]
MGASAKDVQKLLGGMPNSRAKQISKQITINFLKNELFKFLLKSDEIDKLVRLFQFHNEQNLLDLYYKKKPAIIVYSHLGTNLASTVGLYKLGIRVFIIQPRNYFNHTKLIDFLQTPNIHGRKNTPYILKNAYNHLENNGFVLISVDGFVGESAIWLNFLQRKYPFQRGIASLHRLTGAPIIPVSVEWTDKNNLIDFIVHDQITVPPSRKISAIKFDELVTTKIAKWLEEKIVSTPHQIRLNQLSKYLFRSQS